MTSEATTRIRVTALAIILGLLVVDQVSKAVIHQWIGPSASDHRKELIGPIVALEYVENSGAAFGVLPSQASILAIASIAIVALGLAMIWREAGSDPWVAVAIALVVGGAVGNIVDRIRLGYVVDFIAIGVWPKFNVADSAVTVGVLLIVWRMFVGQPAAHQSSVDRSR